MKNNNGKIFIWIIVILVSIGVGSVGMYYGIRYFKPLSQTVVNKLEKEVTVNENGIADAVEKLYDAVVVVESYQKGTLTSSGTGFVYKTDDKNAYILTNNHVISGATEVKVTFTNNQTETVKVVGSDEYTDIGLLSVAKDKVIKVAEIGKAEDTRLGDTAFVIGTPLGSEYSWTVTRGIISGKDRLVEVNASNSNVSSWVMKVLQTDAAINSGNSGGPIANSNGEVIGITNMKLISRGVEGMGFAIPIEDATNKAEQIIKGENVEYPYIGIAMIDVNKYYNSYQYGALIQSSGVTSGVIVNSVEKGSPAAKGKIEANDIITKINDKEVKNVAYLRYYLYQHKVGDTIKVTVIRDGKNKELSVTLGTSKQTT